MPLSCWTYPIHFSHGIPIVLWLLDIFQGCYCHRQDGGHLHFVCKLRSHRKIDPYLQLDELGKMRFCSSIPPKNIQRASVATSPWRRWWIKHLLSQNWGMKIQKSPSYLHTKTRRILLVLIHGDIFGSSKFGTLNSFRETIIFSIQICSFWWWECPIFTKSTKHPAQMALELAAQ